MGVLSFNDNIVIVASEANLFTPSNAVDALLADATADVVYQDVSECTIELVGENVGTEMLRGTNDGVRHAFIKGMANVTITFPLRAFAGAGLPPHYDPIFQAAGLEPTIDNDDVIYRKRTIQLPAMTVHKYYHGETESDWRLQVATGVKGGLTFNFEQGTEPTATFTGTGQYFAMSEPAEYVDPATGEIALLSNGVTPTTARTAGSFSYADMDPMTCTNMVTQLDGTDYFVSGFELNTNIEVTDLLTVNGDTQRRRGLTGRALGARTEGSWAMVDYNDTVQTQIVDLATSGQEFPFTFALASGDGQIAFEAPKAQHGQYGIAANGNFVQYDVPFFLNGDYSDLVGDSEFTFTYSPAP